MSELLRTILGRTVIPDRPAHDETPVPYRLSRNGPQALRSVQGSGEPSEAETLITNQPDKPFPR